MKGMKILVSVAALLIASPASAAGLEPKRAAETKDLPAPTYTPVERPWQGPYIGIGVGYGWQDWSTGAQAANKSECLSWLNSAPGSVLHTEGLTKTQCDNLDTNYSSVQYTPATGAVPAASGTEETFLLTGRLGYDKQLDRVVVGGFAELNYLHLKDDDGPAEYSYALGARAGLLVDPRLLAFIAGGVEITEFDGFEAATNPFLGGGLEYLLNDGWALTGEGRVTFVDEQLGDTQVDNAYTIRALINKKF